MFDFKKFLTITVKDVRLLFTDRNALIYTILTPLLLTVVIGAAFSGFAGSSNNAPIKDIPVAVVNEDAGSAFGNLGTTITQILVPAPGEKPDPTNTLRTLISAQTMNHDDAIAQVKSGKLVAAIIIPADFSQAVTGGSGQGKITVYRDAASSIQGSIVLSVVKAISNSIASGTVAVAAGAQVNPALLLQAQSIAQEVGAQLQSSPPISVNEENIASQPGDTSSFDPLQYFAPSMAVFFMTFTMAAGATSIIEERDNWTLQRLLISPTSRLTVLAGKLGGTYANGILQLTILVVATSLVGPILGSKTSVWGNNVPGLALLLICTVAAATGLGTLLAAAARTSAQADTYSRAVLILLGIAGGAFFPLASLGNFFQFISKLTLNYWAVNGFTLLASGKDISAILPNLAALLVMFAVYFGIGMFLFNRRLEA